MDFKTALTTSLGALLIGSASVAPDFTIGARIVDLDSSFESSAVLVHGDPDRPNGYSRLGIAKINGINFAVYAFQNGAKLDDLAGQGRGFAEVFDGAGHLLRRFAFKENLNSPPQITEYVSVPGQ